MFFLATSGKGDGVLLVFPNHSIFLITSEERGWEREEEREEEKEEEGKEEREEEKEVYRGKGREGGRESSQFMWQEEVAVRS